jgi:hypothetical protein
MIDKVNKLVAKLHLFMKQSPSMHYNAKVLFDAMKGEHKMAEIHYALARMKDFKYVHRIKHGVYQLTTMDKPIEKMFSKKRPKARKPRTINPAVSLEKQMQKWDEEQAKVDFQDLCQKLQNALAKSYVDCDLLEATVSEQRTIIKYLESKVRETATV